MDRHGQLGFVMDLDQSMLSRYGPPNILGILSYPFLGEFQKLRSTEFGTRATLPST